MVNLKGQVYLLTIENELLKQQSQQLEAVAKTSPGRARAADVEPPEELSDLEAMMRAKYAQLENKYVGELTEAKRAAEALATQCAAQSSLVSALKLELDRANAVVSQQRQSLQMTKEQAAVELQHAHDEAEHLRDDVQRLQRHIAGARSEAACAWLRDCARASCGVGGIHPTLCRPSNFF
jgi:predicted  nucleic acid-binding Zn-ribbon protein